MPAGQHSLQLDSTIELIFGELNKYPRNCFRYPSAFGSVNSAYKAFAFNDFTLIISQCARGSGAGVEIKG